MIVPPARRPGVLANREFRNLWLGRAISDVGTWMQRIALAWLAFTSTGSSVVMSWVIALEQLPVLLLSAYAGVLVSRVDTRRLMLALQAVMAAHALALGGLAMVGTPAPWTLYLLAAILGVCLALDLTAHEVLFQELLRQDQLELRSTLALRAVTANVITMAGPALGGVLTAWAGERSCFLVNAASFAPVLFVLLRLDSTARVAAPRLERVPGQIREGLRHAAADPAIAAAVLMLATGSALGLQHAVFVPPLVEQALHGGPRARGLMETAISLGAVGGGLYLLFAKRAGLFSASVAAFGAALLLALLSIVPTLWLAWLTLAALGVATITFSVGAKSVIQETAPPALRPRVTALYPLALSMGAVGAPLVGWIIAATDVRTGVRVGAAAFMAAGTIGWLGRRRNHQSGALDRQVGR